MIPAMVQSPLNASGAGSAGFRGQVDRAQPFGRGADHIVSTMLKLNDAHLQRVGGGRRRTVDHPARIASGRATSASNETDVVADVGRSERAANTVLLHLEEKVR